MKSFVLMLQSVALLVLALGLSGCSSFSAQFDRSTLAGAPAVASPEKLPGRVLIRMSDAARNYVFSGNPFSHMARGSELTAPLGEMTEQMSLLVFNEMFDGGAVTDGLADDSAFRLIVEPTVNAFEYAYYTPSMSLIQIAGHMQGHIRITTPAGRVLVDRPLDTGLVHGEPYAILTTPNHSQVLNNILYDEMRLIAEEAAEALTGAGNYSRRSGRRLSHRGEAATVGARMESFAAQTSAGSDGAVDGGDSALMRLRQELINGKIDKATYDARKRALSGDAKGGAGGDL
ncbi:hypothetical protein [Magnetofaba australis]|nr:hypothetical protein [Magnetofaba australis]